MYLFKLKEILLRKKFDKMLSKLARNRNVSQKKIRTVGILTTETIASKTAIQSRVEAILGVRDSKMYRFKKFEKAASISYTHFSEKDISWKGNFAQPNFKSFLEYPFDLLIGYFDEEHLYVERAILQSNASFKAGFSGVNSKLYELEIVEVPIKIDAFLLELKKYLQILQKLKN